MNSGHNTTMCPDWVSLNNANVHVAKDRGWFKTYTPFTSRLNGSPLVGLSTYLPVLGIGTVEIPMKRSPNTSGVSSHGTLLLHDVLHVPDVICNFIGQPLMFTDGYNPILKSGTQSSGTIKDSQGKNVAYFDPKSPLYALELRRPPNGPRLGPYALKNDVLYMLGCRWNDVETRKWQEFKARNGLPTSGHGAASYTAEETAFLKENYRSEFHFLLQHGLKIHNEEDREEGRAILRAIMRADDDESDDSEEDFDDESAFEGSQADYNFTHRQLDWIEQHYRNSEQFMIAYGLKFYDNVDLEEAKAIVEVMTSGDD